MYNEVIGARPPSDSLVSFKMTHNGQPQLPSYNYERIHFHLHYRMLQKNKINKYIKILFFFVACRKEVNAPPWPIVPLLRYFRVMMLRAGFILNNSKVVFFFLFIFFFTIFFSSPRSCKSFFCCALTAKVSIRLEHLTGLCLCKLLGVLFLFPTYCTPFPFHWTSVALSIGRASTYQPTVQVIQPFFFLSRRFTLLQTAPVSLRRSTMTKR